MAQVGSSVSTQRISSCLHILQTRTSKHYIMKVVFIPHTLN